MLYFLAFVASLKTLKDQTKEEHFPQHEKKKGYHNKEEVRKLKFDKVSLVEKLILLFCAN